MDCSSQSNVWEWTCHAFLKSEPPVSWIEWPRAQLVWFKFPRVLTLQREASISRGKNALNLVRGACFLMTVTYFQWAEDVVGEKNLILRHSWFKCISFLPWNLHEAASVWGCVGKLSSGPLVWVSLVASLLMSAFQQFMWKLMHLSSIVALISYFLHRYTWSFGGVLWDDTI